MKTRKLSFYSLKSYPHKIEKLHFMVPASKHKLKQKPMKMENFFLILAPKHPDT